MKTEPFDLKSWLKERNRTQCWLAVQVGVEERTVRNWVRRGEVPYLVHQWIRYKNREAGSE